MGLFRFGSRKRVIATTANMQLNFRGISESYVLNLEGSEALSDVAAAVTVPLKGGKVHGSLARAGKVRGQTPKVEAGEKKKKKTGRAKRRIQYVRRFVNVVETFGGRKKGPNSNSE